MRHVPAPVLPSEAEVEAHNVSHLPFRCWCSACVRGRGLSLGHRRVDAKIKGRTDPDNFGGLWVLRGHTVPSKGVTHPYPARALMADLDFMVYKRVILKSDQDTSIVALCDAVKNGWHGEVVPEASPKGESRSNGEVERALCMDLRGPSKTSWNHNLESRWSLEVRCWLGWWSIVPNFFDSPTRANFATVIACMRWKGKPWRALLSASTTESALTSWSRGGQEVCSWVQVTTTKRIVMDATERYVVQSVRRFSEERRHDDRLLQSVIVSVARQRILICSAWSSQPF